MRIVFAGTPDVAVASLDALVQQGHDIVGVLTREDAPLGRKRVLTASPVALRAEQLGIDVKKVNRLGPEVTEWVKTRNPKLGVVVAYGGLLKRELLDAPELGWINLHFSLLPKWRGAAPVQRALMNGEEQLGLSVFRLVEALDAGDLVATRTQHVALGTPAGDALALLAREGATLLGDAVELLEAHPSTGTPQVGEATYAHKLSREDGKLDPSSPVTSVIARWAGTTPEPGAFVEHDGQALKLHEIRMVEAHDIPDTAGIPAIGMAIMVGKRAMLGTDGGAVELIRVQPAGKASMDGAAWLRGRGGSARLS